MKRCTGKKLQRDGLFHSNARKLLSALDKKLLSILDKKVTLCIRQKNLLSVLEKKITLCIIKKKLLSVLDKNSIFSYVTLGMYLMKFFSLGKLVGNITKDDSTTKDIFLIRL